MLNFEWEKNKNNALFGQTTPSIEYPDLGSLSLGELLAESDEEEKKPNFCKNLKIGLISLVIGVSSIWGINFYLNSVGVEVYKFEGRDNSDMPDYELTVDRIGDVYIEEHSRGESNRQIVFSSGAYSLFTAALNYCELNKNGRKLSLIERINYSAKADSNNDRKVSKEEAQVFYDAERERYFKKK